MFNRHLNMIHIIILITACLEKVKLGRDNMFKPASVLGPLKYTQTIIIDYMCSFFLLSILTWSEPLDQLISKWRSSSWIQTNR